VQKGSQSLQKINKKTSDTVFSKKRQDVKAQRGLEAMVFRHEP
jgi:hypothetical protein